MHRRKFLLATCGAAMATRWAGAGESPSNDRTLLSTTGCGRATGYAEANKIVTLGDQTHVCWLDSVDEGFRARVRTLDRTSSQWSSTQTLGEAHDNHGGPALTADSQGFLHVVYGPHHHPFRYRVSARPNDASEWRQEIEFGQRCTYPTLVCGSDDTLYLSCRESDAKTPWRMILWTKPQGADWMDRRVIAQARFPGYSHFQESLAWGPDQRRLHLCCRFHEKSDRQAYGRLQTVAYMYSDDFGATWRRADGSAIDGPATAETADVLESGGVDRGRTLRAGAMSVDPAGNPVMLYSVMEEGRGRSFLVLGRDGDRWNKIDMNQHLPDRYRDWDLIMPGGVTFDGQGRLVCIASLQNVERDEDSWGHGSNEIVAFISADRGRSFTCKLISGRDPKTSHWLPNLERPTGGYGAARQPSVIYTAGGAGENNKEILSNKVYWHGG